MGYQIAQPKDIWLGADQVVSPLGMTSEQNFQAVLEGRSGIRHFENTAWSDHMICAAYAQEIKGVPGYTRFESMGLAAMRSLKEKNIPAKRTLFILSTTKGNIDLLSGGKKNERLPLHATAKFFADQLNLDKYVVISNACISGSLAMIYARRVILSGKYDHAVIVAADTLGKFVISGFKALGASSPEPCLPFDAGRKGINLGEAAAVSVLSAKPDEVGIKKEIRLIAGAVNNDANHISGPSRTGEELAMAIRRSMAEARVEAQDIDFVSAHGTATLYNDEMEANAFSHAGISDIPVNSLKGYFGHTLGAAGLVESIISAKSLLSGRLVPSHGFKQQGTTKALNMILSPVVKEMNICLKTASGFGGCNAAIILQKH